MQKSSLKNLIFYMTGQASWYFVNGLQMVLFPTILILMLGVSPSNYGLAQVSLLAPSIFLIVLGGTIADKTDTRILLAVVHFLASLPLLLILFSIQFGFLSFGVMIIYGLTMGSISAFVIPLKRCSINHNITRRNSKNSCYSNAYSVWISTDRHGYRRIS